MAARADDDEDEGQDGDRHRTIRIYSQESQDLPGRPSRDESRAGDGSGYLGVQVQDVTRALQRARNLPTEEGALVNRVEQDSPADRNGIRRGDVIVEVDGQKVGDSGDLIRAVRGLEPGNRVRITLWRSGSLRTVTAQLAERPKSEPPAPPNMGRWPGNDGDDDASTPMPPMPMPGMRDREQVRREIKELQDQLQELKAEVRALRAELRRSRDRRDDDDRDRDDD
jgi:hypothetical protein